MFVLTAIPYDIFAYLSLSFFQVHNKHSLSVVEEKWMWEQRKKNQNWDLEKLYCSYSLAIIDYNEKLNGEDI